MNRILQQIQSDCFDPKTVFTGGDNEIAEVKTALEQISVNLSKEVCIKFIVSKIIPTIFDKNAKSFVRDGAIEMGLNILQYVNITFLDIRKQESILNSIETTYAGVIAELRDNNSEHWHKLWIFLIKLCGDKLHTKLSVTNKLLRIVEVAFRNATSIEPRLKAYDCWIELINVSSLNMDHMCSPKQIKLLITPMKAKFSRMPIVIMKRCDTFVYLLEKLQDKATLCLKEFLEFCFGLMDDKSSDKVRHGRLVPEVCSKSTKVLLEIIGHSHFASEICMTDENLQIYKPLINENNFPNFKDVLISASVECCVLLGEWNQDYTQNKTVIRCLWTSLLRLIRKTDKDIQEKCCNIICTSIRIFLIKSDFKTPAVNILAQIVSLLIQDDFIYNLENLLTLSFDVLFKLSDDYRNIDVEYISNFIISHLSEEKGSKYHRIAIDSFKNGNKCENTILCDLWLKCETNINLSDINYLLWPIHHLENFKDIEAVVSKWFTILSTNNDIENLKVMALQELEKIFTENPLLSSKIILFLEIISAEMSFSKEGVSKLLKLIEKIFSLPTLPDEDVKKLRLFILNFCNQNQYFYKIENNNEAMDRFCSCINHLVTTHKDHNILTDIINHLKNGQPKNIVKFSKHLIPLLENLMLNEDHSSVNNTKKLIAFLESKANDLEATNVTSRSKKIVSLVNTRSKTLSDSIKNNFLQLHNRNPDTLSRSLKNSSPSVNKKNKVTTTTINDDKSSDFVKIDTEVKLNINNLSEHQKEVLKKRREDIPALYSDLTESQSQDYFENVQNCENSKSNQSVEKNSFEDIKSPKKRSSSCGNESKSGKSKRISFNSLAYLSMSPKKKKRTSNENTLKDCRIVIENIIPETVNSETVQTEKIVSPKNKNISRVTINEAKVSSDSNEVDKNSTDQNLYKAVEVRIDKIENGKEYERSRKSKVYKTQCTKNQETSQQENQLQNGINDIALTNSENAFEDQNFNKDKAENIMTVGKIIEKKIQEPSIRKSGRQIKARFLDYLAPLPKKRNVQRRRRSKSAADRIVDEQEKESKLETVKDCIDLNTIDKNIENKGDNNALDSKTNDLLSSSHGDSFLPFEEPNTSKTNEHQAITEVIQNKTEISLQNTPAKKDIKKNSDCISERSRKLHRKKSFSRDDYIKKRKKKVKKTNDSSFAGSHVHNKAIKTKNNIRSDFHITAENSIPLSESPSLRTVAFGDSINLSIVRSPSDSNVLNDGSLNDVKLNDETSKFLEDSSIINLVSPRKKSPRKQSPNSEDVIESSQEPSIVSPTVKKLPSPRSKSRVYKQTTIDEVIKPVTRSSSAAKSESPKKQSAIRKQNETIVKKLFEEETEKLPSQVISTETQDVKHDNDSSADTLTCDLAEPKVIETQEAETLSLDIHENKTKDLPASPITCDTPDRTVELLNSTSDLSPISVQPETSTHVSKTVTNEVSNIRVARLLQMVNSNVQVSSQGSRWFGQKHSSPKRNRRRKSQMKTEETLDILTFSREVPSPLTVPSSGILKRKLNQEEGVSPAAKRKRVNFSDPAITDKKLFIKDTDEYIEATDETSEKKEDENSVNNESKELLSDICPLNDFKDSNKSKKALELLQSLKLEEVLDLVSEYVTTLDSESSDKIMSALKKEGFSERMINYLIGFDDFIPKLIDVLKKLPEDQVDHIKTEIEKIYEDLKPDKFASMREKQTEDYVNNFKSDKMITFIQNYSLNLQGETRNEFLLNLMKWASRELPVNKEFINSHVSVLQNFVERMTD